MKEALFYEKLGRGQVLCSLCPHQCKLAPEGVGLCRVRVNDKGILRSKNYGIISSWGVDPIEKKPLYHFYPGQGIFSVASVGCNFRCKFCQNWSIAQSSKTNGLKITAKDVVEKALLVPGNLGIAYTYNEPLVGYEFVLDCSQLARKYGLKNVLITNGFIEKEPLEELLPLIDAMNIDIKGNGEFYREMISGDLTPVMATVERSLAKCHIEITNLIIPGVNDTADDIANLAQWVASLGKDTPLHLNRYFPNYKLDLPATPVATVERAREIARGYLDYVYTGNGADPKSANTYCPTCKLELISRRIFPAKVALDEGSCPRCGGMVAGVFL